MDACCYAKKFGVGHTFDHAMNELCSSHADRVMICFLVGHVSKKCQYLIAKRGRVQFVSVRFSVFVIISLSCEMPLGALFGPSCGPLGASRGPLGALLEPSWGPLGALLGPSWGSLGPTWGPLGALLGLSWGPLGALLGRLGAFVGPLEALLGLFWGPLGAVLG
jgi:hypothetical protein